MKYKRMREEKNPRLFRYGSNKNPTTFNLHKPLVQQLDILAERWGTSRSDVLAEIVDYYLAEQVNKGMLKPPPASAYEGDDADGGDE